MAAAGKNVPALKHRPDPLGYAWLLEAFAQLGTCRSLGFTVGRIPWTATEAWAVAHGLGHEEKWVLHEVIHYMDTLFIEYHHKRQPKK